MTAAAAHPARRWLREYWPFAAPLTLLALLTVRPVELLARGLWQTDDHAFSPILVVIGLVMCMQIARTSSWQGEGTGASSGLLLLILGLGCVKVGNVLGNIFLEFGAIIPCFVGMLAYLGGWAMVGEYLLPILVWCFAIPLPGAVLTALTFPLKMAISDWAASILFVVGLPVSHEGVVIEIGNYRLLVADACSGLQSMFSMVGIALVYAFIMQYRDWPRVIILLIASIPVVIATNLLRVIILALITYLFGIGVSEGPLHLMTGLVLFAVAFFLLMAIDEIYELPWYSRRKI